MVCWSFSFLWVKVIKSLDINPSRLVGRHRLPVWLLTGSVNLVVFLGVIVSWIWRAKLLVRTIVCSCSGRQLFWHWHVHTDYGFNPRCTVLCNFYSILISYRGWCSIRILIVSERESASRRRSSLETHKTHSGSSVPDKTPLSQDISRDMYIR